MSQRPDAAAVTGSGADMPGNFASVRRSFLDPISAIMGYADLVLEDARRENLSEVLPDLERIAVAGGEALALIDRVLEMGSGAAPADPDELKAVQSRLRHDLRNALNAIKGYTELILEDMEDMGAQVLENDLTALLSEAKQLLSQLGTISDLGPSSQGDNDQAASEAKMIADLASTIRQVEPISMGLRDTGRILVVDDSASNRALLLRRLTRDGHQVAEAEGGQQALDILMSDDFDLVLLDLLMPDINGYQVLKAIRDDERLRDVRVIMVSGQQETDSVLRCIEAGAEDYLPKPIDPVLLNARIGACLERKRWRDRERDYLRQLQEEKRKSETLLLNILPEKIVQRINHGETLIADRHENVTVLFLDIVGFTRISSRISPAEIVEKLNRLFSAFDALALELGVEKVKTIGDAYMVASGLADQPDHIPRAADMALGMIDIIARLNKTEDHPWQARIGLHSGPVVAGVIGTHKFVYDIWGSTVNVASRMESYGKPDRIHISGAVARSLASHFDVERRGIIDIRGMGQLETFFLIGRKTG